MRSSEQCGGLGPLTSIHVTLGRIRDTQRIRTGYEFRLIRLEGSDEVPVSVFWQLKNSS